MSVADFVANKLPENDLDYAVEAGKRGCSEIKVRIMFDAYNSIHLQKPLWKNPDLNCLDSAHFEIDSKTSLLENEDSILSQMAIDLAHIESFPLNTTYFHSLAIVCSAMTRNFTYKLGHYTNPVNEYMISSQPSGAGKSAIHQAFFKPFFMANYDRNQGILKKLKSLEKKLFALKNAMKNAKNNVDELVEITKEHDDLESELEDMKVVDIALTQATIASTESILIEQNGFFNILSDEAESINVMLGGTYAQSGKADMEVFLKGFEGGYFKGLRASRESYAGYVRMSLGVIAQDDAVNQLIDVGQNGRGAFERCLIFKERSLIGYRTHDENLLDFEPDQNAISAYNSMMIALVNSKPKQFIFDRECKKFILDVKRRFEPLLKSGEKYGEAVWQGTVSKAPYHICKLACALYAVDNIRKNEGYDLTIGLEYVKRSASIYFKILDNMYKSVNQMSGLSKDPLLEDFLAWAEVAVKKSTTLKFDEKRIYNSLRNRKAFKDIPNFKTYFLENMIEKLETANIIVHYRGFIYLNPNLNN